MAAALLMGIMFFIVSVSWEQSRKRKILLEIELQKKLKNMNKE